MSPSTQVLNTQFSIKIASNQSEIEQALQLRYQVFVEEAKKESLINTERFDTDEFDEVCDHLIVSDSTTGQIVGTYRLLPGTRTVHGGRFYSETLFDMSAFDSYRLRTLELGRSCVHPDFRGGKVISLLWEGIADYIVEHNLDFLIGCASMHRSTSQQTNDVYSCLRRKNMITDDFGIEPLQQNQIQDLQEQDIQFRERDIYRRLPPLIKGYQRLGAQIAGKPAYDPFFDTILFFIIFETHRITDKYRRNFLAR